MVNFGKMKQTAAMAKAYAKNGIVAMTVADLSKYYGGPTLNHISLEYLLSSNVFPLGIMLQLFGSEGCCKSTLAMNLLDQMFLQNGAEGRLLDTENKVSPTLIKGLLSSDAVADGRFMAMTLTTQEKVQTALTLLGKEINEATFGKSRDTSVPRMMGVVLDSFRVASETTQEKVMAEGHASKNYAVEANLWRTFLASYVDVLKRAPMSLIVVNHMVEKESSMGYGKVKDVGGGMALKFFETYRILVTKVNSKTDKSEAFTDLSLQTFKNSNGEAKRKIYPRVIYRSPNLEEGRHVVDWNIADIKLLSGPDIPREAMKKANVCNVKESSVAGLYSDDVLGLSKVPAEQILQTIYSDPGRLSELRRILGIHEYKTLDELWEQGWFFNAREAEGYGDTDEPKVTEEDIE